jgi:intracellular septation protein
LTDTPAAPRLKPKALNPALKFALELGPLALFFIVYKLWDYLPATAVLMASVAVTLGVSYRILGRLPTMPLLQLKPTALYLLFAGALFVGLAMQKNLLAIMFDSALHVTPEGWRRLTWRWAFFFLALAVLNEGVRHYCNDGVGSVCTFDTWVKFKTFGFLPLTVLFALAQAPLISKYESVAQPSGDEI